MRPIIYRQAVKYISGVRLCPLLQRVHYTNTAYLVVSATATTFTIATAAAPSTALSITTSTATNIIVASPSFSFSTSTQRCAWLLAGIIKP